VQAEIIHQEMLLKLFPGRKRDREFEKDEDVIS
jgi:hypothetical protein